jgi:hypothetical protein
VQRLMPEGAHTTFVVTVRYSPVTGHPPPPVRLLKNLLCLCGDLWLPESPSCENTEVPLFVRSSYVRAIASIGR